MAQAFSQDERREPLSFHSTTSVYNRDVWRSIYSMFKCSWTAARTTVSSSPKNLSELRNEFSYGWCQNCLSPEALQSPALPELFFSSVMMYCVWYVSMPHPCSMPYAVQVVTQKQSNLSFINPQNIPPVALWSVRMVFGKRQTLSDVSQENGCFLRCRAIAFMPVQWFADGGC